MQANGLRLIGYARVSTDNQANEGTIEIQLHALREYAALNGHELVDTFTDEGVSGGLEHRPGLSLLFEYLDEHDDVDGVLIFKLDRLARDLMIQENLIRDFEKKGKRIISTKEPDLDSKDATRVFIRQILGSVSQYEKAIITMRLSGGRHNKARKGLHAGGRVQSAIRR
jgi:site-specific DNA recombinase